ncbi:MAG: RsmE family RNA methyltransferase, partial [Elusimicrobiota bacterium]|nr:RsmE family RNA methyltransferase [Elusimicrobiota bacterium]
AGISAGDAVIVGDSNFREFKAKVIEVSKDSYVVKVKSKVEICRVPPRKITLFVSLPKKKKMENIIFKCTQLGVEEFIPVISSRTIKKITSRQREKTYERWRKKARKGAEISMRKNLPVIRETVNFKEALEIYSREKFGSGIIFWEQNENQKYIQEKDIALKMAVFIGPEGGFSSKEVEAAIKAGLKMRTLGALILDVETAVIAGVSRLLCGES